MEATKKEVLEREVWNTGRLYQSFGQVIIAEVVRGDSYSERLVRFNDISRMIDGTFKTTEASIRNYGVKQITMQRYDTDDYQCWGGGDLRLTDEERAKFLPPPR